VDQTVKDINAFAQIQHTTFSQVPLDFILATESYSMHNGAQFIDSSSFLQCFPCDPTSQQLQRKQQQQQQVALVADPHPQKSVRSIALQFEGQFVLSKLKVVLDALLYNNGDTSAENNGLVGSSKIFRMKGVLHVVGEGNLFVLQGVHEMFDLQPSSHAIGSVEDKSNGKNLIVVIGCDLEQDKIHEVLLSCLQ
jgi:G3E family GTPase